MTSRRLRFQAALATRGGKVLTAAVIAFGALLLYLLSGASANTPMFAQGLPQLLAAGVGAILLLISVAGYQLLVLRRRLKQRVFGAKLTLRMVLLFVLVSVLPGALVYAVSVQFLARSIDGWFDVRVDRALEGGLSLGRNVLDGMLHDLTQKADEMALSLSDKPIRQQQTLVHRLREHHGVHEAAIINDKGEVLAFSSEGKGDLLPEMPRPAVLRDIRLQKNHASVVSESPRGLLLRVVVPVNTKSGQFEALQLVQPVAAAVARDADAVRQAHEEYKGLSLLRVGLKRLYGLTLTLALLLALCCALLLAIFFSQRLSAPLSVLAEGTRAVAQGDFRQRSAVRSYDELEVLTQSFNTMTRELSDAQRDTERYQEQLETAKGSLESILGNISAGVISLDGDGKLRSFNPSANRILGVQLDRLLDLPVTRWPEFDARLGAISLPLIKAFAEAPDRDWQQQVTYSSAQGELTLLLRVSAIAQHLTQGFVVVFDDITNLLRAQRQAAWGEVARRLAHEIKNPLTPIQLSAERLQHRLQGKLETADGDMLSRMTHTIVNQVAALKNLVDAFSQYARSPEPNLRAVDLGGLTREVLSLYESPASIVTQRIEPNMPKVIGDPAKLRQVIHNLLQNAEDAVASTTQPQIIVSVERAGDRLALSVTDSGPGFPADIIARAAEPYVTTKPKGTGLGLAIVQKIVEEHNGQVRIENVSPRGARVSVFIPIAAASEGPSDPHKAGDASKVVNQ